MSFPLTYCFSILCLLPFLITAQKHENITLGSSLTAGDQSSSWVSPSGDFAFGFQEVGTGSYLLAIWFNNIPEKTVTWSANRDMLAPRDSKLLLTSGGRLVLTDPSSTELWSASPSGLTDHAVMLDTGNLVLEDVNSVILWQSFDSPTDTILPTQVMKLETSLKSRVTDANYSTGRFQLRLQGDDKNLVFYLKYSPIQPDWLMPPYDFIITNRIGLQVVFNQSGSIYLVKSDGSQDGIFEADTDSALYYQRAILEFDGVFRKYVYPRSSSKSLPMKWTMRDLRPRNICIRNSGRGVCGSNSICQIGDDEIQRTKCECPQGYSFLDQIDQMKGCKPNFIQQSCFDEQEENDGQFHLVEMPHTNFPDSSQYEYLYGTTEVSCRTFCLSDCYCAAVIFNGDNSCYKMRLPLSNGWVNQSEASNPSKTFIKIRIGNSTIQPIGGVHKETKHQTVILIESVFLGSSVFLNILLLTLAVFVVTCYPYKTKPKTREVRDIAGTNMRNFTYMELEEATNGFKEKVGQGAFSTVYKGLLDLEDGSVIAVKKLNETAKENQREFESEVKAIARTGHRNLVQLIGFCNEGQHRLLVYEYMPNGSLADILFQDPRPNLMRRMKFALETATGLNYLHEECMIQIIHCDIKLQNILLDDSFTSRISDFGLAKLLKKDQAQTITGIRGTKGYVAPEWFRSIPVTTKVDVYSYGILLLELICCRRCFEAEMEDESRMVLADWAYDCYEEGRVDKLVEGDNEELADVERIEKLVVIALECIQEDPSLRPSMNKVVRLIKEALNDSLPPFIHMSPRSLVYGDSQPSGAEYI